MRAPRHLILITAGLATITAATTIATAAVSAGSNDQSEPRPGSFTVVFQADNDRFLAVTPVGEYGSFREASTPADAERAAAALTYDASTRKITTADGRCLRGDGPMIFDQCGDDDSFRWTPNSDHFFDNTAAPTDRPIAPKLYGSRQIPVVHMGPSAAGLTVLPGTGYTRDAAH